MFRLENFMLHLFGEAVTVYTKIPYRLSQNKSKTHNNEHSAYPLTLAAPMNVHNDHLSV